MEAITVTNSDGIDYTRVNKTTARDFYNKNKHVVLFASNIAPFGPAISGIELDRPTHKKANIDQDFDHHVKAFKWYNCDYERGRGVHFYVNSLELQEATRPANNTIKQFTVISCVEDSTRPAISAKVYKRGKATKPVYKRGHTTGEHPIKQHIPNYCYQTLYSYLRAPFNPYNNPDKV